MPHDKIHKLRQLLNAKDQDVLAKQLSDIGEGNIAELLQLLERYRNLVSDIRQKQDTSRGLSRQIGEAKKKGISIDPLLTEMRTLSAEIKHLNEILQTQETSLLAYLPDTDTVNTGSSPPELPQTRQYRDARYNNNIHISELQDDTSAWNHYVTQHPACSIYHLAQWRDVIRQSFGHEAHYFYAHDTSGTIKGVLPLIRLNSRLFGDFMVSMPYFNYGGAIGDHPMIEDALIQRANQHAIKLGLEHIEYRDDIAKPDFPERTDKVNMILPLPDQENTLWQTFTPKLRSQIRRPQREDTCVKHGSLELLDDFYRVFARNMRDLGTPVYSKQFFELILRTFPEQTQILTVYLGTKAVACAFLIGYKEILEIPWASTLRTANHLSVNMLMYWEVLRFAIRKNFLYFDFGRSSVDSGTYKFKKQWGAQAKQLYWHYWLNNREMPSLNPSNPKYKLMINIWKRLPIWLTNSVGPLIVKNLP